MQSDIATFTYQVSPHMVGLPPLILKARPRKTIRYAIPVIRSVIGIQSHGLEWPVVPGEDVDKALDDQPQVGPLPPRGHTTEPKEKHHPVYSCIAGAWTPIFSAIDLVHRPRIARRHNRRHHIAMLHKPTSSLAMSFPGHGTQNAPRPRWF
ncbi:hypothetical protein BD413DRAFT_512904 [Trametes elegans]|nr:hypothetical protein BD413DRAFT_512904 [Trametes elegans]